IVSPLSHVPILQLTGEKEASRRDWGTVGACCASAERGANIVRVHNVMSVSQALAVADAIRGAASEDSSGR
ncbi:unnamed protein product, partial [Sphacelaria rigidula]